MNDEANGIVLVRQTFGKLLPDRYSVAQAFMRYEHAHDVEWQVLTFHVIDPTGQPHVIESDRVPARDNINELAAKTARRFVERLKEGSHEPPTGGTPADGGSGPSDKKD